MTTRPAGQTLAWCVKTRNVDRFAGTLYCMNPRNFTAVLLLLVALAASNAIASAQTDVGSINTSVQIAAASLPRDPYDDPRFSYRLAGAADRRRVDPQIMALRLKEHRRAQIAKAHAAALRYAARLARRRHHSRPAIAATSQKPRSTALAAQKPRAHATTNPQRRDSGIAFARPARRVTQPAMSRPPQGETLRWYGWGKL
jgi:hypothetical protein